MKARFTPAANRELKEAARWYEKQQVGLGQRFKRVIQKALARLKEYPESGFTHPDGIRSSVVPVFPYVLWYEPFDDEILIHAVSHSRRKPGYWMG